MPLWKKKTASDSEATTPPSVTAPGPTGVSLVKRVETAQKVLLTKGLGDQKLAVMLLIDRSGSMRGYFRDGSVQNLVEQTLGLVANVDDDGTVQMAYFDSRLKNSYDVRIGDHVGAVDHHHQAMGGNTTMGGTDYSVGLEWARQTYLKEYPKRDVPALLIFQTDGQTWDEPKAEAAVTRLANEVPMVIGVLAFGADKSEFAFLEKLDETLPRPVDNLFVVHLGADPKKMSDADLYSQLTDPIPAFIDAARRVGPLTA